MVFIERAHEGDKEARETLIAENLGLVWSIVRRFENRGHDREELFQIGSMGLMKAIDKFDTSFNVRFSTYAVPVISGEIKRFLRDDGLIKVSRTLKENGYKIQQAVRILIVELGRDPTISEISEATNFSREEIVLAMDANLEVESIYKSVYQSDGSELYLVDQIVAGGNGGVGCVTGKNSSTFVNAMEQSGSPQEEELVNHMLIEQLLGDLEDTERQLIQLRYYEDKTQSQIAEILGISQVQVSRMEKKILLNMRGKIRN